MMIIGNPFESHPPDTKIVFLDNPLSTEQANGAQIATSSPVKYMTATPNMSPPKTAG